MSPLAEVRNNVQRQKRWATKVRTGCFTCRQRRVKCDEAKPSCQNCTKRNLECAGYGPAWMSSGQRALAPASLQKQRVPLPTIEVAAMNDVVQLFNLMPNFLMPAPSGETHTTLRVPMRHTTALYLTLLPSRAGHSAVMDACVHALAAIARLYYETTMNKGLALEEIAELDEYDRVLCLYNRALKFLRQALDDPDESVSSETLCATELLCCFESFNLNGSPEIQIQHMMGSAHLIQHRKAQSFKSSFDLMLLRTQMPFLLFGSFYANTTCFLQQPEWTVAVLTIARSSPDIDRCLVYFMVFVGQIFNDLVSINKFMMTHDRTSLEAMAERRRLLEAITEHGEAFTKWQCEAQPKVQQALIEFEATRKDTTQDIYNQSLIATARPFYGSSLATILLQNRLRVALGCAGASVLERESQDIAIELRRRVIEDKELAERVAVFETTAFHAALMSKDDWKLHASRLEDLDEDKDRTISRDVYFTWIRALGVRVDDSSVAQKLSLLLPVKATKLLTKRYS